MEHWEAPEDLHDIASIARRRNTSHTLIAPLEPWTSLDAGLHNASGIGYYETSFSWPPSSGAADGAFLCLGTVVHAVKIYVNGNPVPALDPTAPRVDLGPFLRKGQNDVLAVVVGKADLELEGHRCSRTIKQRTLYLDDRGRVRGSRVGGHVWMIGNCYEK